MSVADAPLEDKKKSQKYDRQLRLWGDHGQHGLETASICLINATTAGCETLKNLILPGVGSFTIVDSKLVSPQDAGTNFFVSRESIGQSRAKATCEKLRLLNPAVTGHFTEESLEHLLADNSVFFHQFRLVIATDLHEKQLLALGEVLWTADVPLVAVRTYGLVATMRLQVREQFVVESHPEYALDDLRITAPFAALRQHVSSVDLNAMELEQHSHVPYVVLLVKALDQWRLTHDKDPSSTAERNEFKQILRKKMLKPDEANFEQAINFVFKALAKPEVPSAVQALFNDPACENLTSQSTPEWIVTRALRDFVQNEGNGLLPLSGSIPDMVSDSNSFVSLQKVYHDKYSEDYAAIAKRVEELLTQLNRAQDTISPLLLRLFCKNSHSLRLVRTRSVRDELDFATAKTPDIGAALENPSEPAWNIVYYLLLRAVDQFYEENNRFPGDTDDSVSGDIATLRAQVQTILHKLNLDGDAVKQDYAHEMCRFGAAELHNVASLMGGVASQEICKILTKQWVPFNNTFIYNGMNSSSVTFEL